jgi:hypothetical protein
MARLKGQELLRMQKEAKLKKLLFVLVPIFLALMVWQGPGYVKMLTGGDEQAAEPAPTPTAPAATTPDPTTAPPPSTAVPGGAPVAAPGGTPATLTDSDRPASPDAGQLIGFDRFVGKDPFRQIVDTTPPPAPDPTVTPTPTNPGGSGGNGTDPGDGGDDDEPAVPVAAVLAVNGVKETVRLEETFPESEKLFVLTRLTRSSAWIGLAAGEYSNGKDAIEVELGKTLNLVSQPDGIRYTIKVVRIRLR